MPANYDLDKCPVDRPEMPTLPAVPAPLYAWIEGWQRDPVYDLLPLPRLAADDTFGFDDETIEAFSEPLAAWKNEWETYVERLSNFHDQERYFDGSTHALTTEEVNHLFRKGWVFQHKQSLMNHQGELVHVMQVHYMPWETARKRKGLKEATEALRHSVQMGGASESFESDFKEMMAEVIAARLAGAMAGGGDNGNPFAGSFGGNRNRRNPFS